MKRLMIFLIMMFLVVPIGMYAMGYHGPRDFSGTSHLPKSDLVIRNARALIGTPYDPLMGMYGNIGAKAGFIVCSDVPNIAFGASGYSWKEVLEKDFKVNSKFYNSDNGNKPGNPFFHRRARNLYAYFRANGRLKTGDFKPEVGDLVFYRKSNNGYIAHVALVSAVTRNGYKLIESAPGTLVVQEVDQTSPIERGWIYSGVGSVYN